MTSNSTINVFGIRHHGPGSARSLLKALAELQPDAILVEGPPDAAKVLPLLAHAEMQPPVALLVYMPEQPQQAVYYPFAVFSPEWQALHYGLTQNIPVRFMDLPVEHHFAAQIERLKEALANPIPPAAPNPDTPATDLPIPDTRHLSPEIDTRQDPLGWLAEAAGYSDGERWWEHMVEHRQDGTDLFAAILEAMSVLREEVPPTTDLFELQREAQREAYMRQTIRKAQQEGYQRIAVICGAWHAPVLAKMPFTPQEDAATLKDLPSVKVAATWVPWTHGRLSYMSGYGAGIESPGWYHHLWTVPDQVAIRWMTKVARLLRGEDLDASSAHVIEAVRLAESLAVVRDRPLPGLPELNEATQAVLLFGETLPLKLISEKLIVGETLGAVPDETPMIPLQQDLTREQKRLRLPPEAGEVRKEFDLRNQTDRERSCLLHRLNLLGITWGRAERASGKGTFKEAWALRWLPEYAVKLIEAGVWGNTVFDAAAGCVRENADKASDLPALTKLIDMVVLAELPAALDYLIAKLQEQAARSSDVAHLMGALPPLASVLRYGNVRQTDTTMISGVVDGLVARICIGLPGACASLNDEAATEMLKLVDEVNSVITLLQNADYRTAWYGILTKMTNQHGLNGLLAGRFCRILLDAGAVLADESAIRMGLALSTANEPAQAAAWVEGFLQGSGLLLLHDDKLWQVLDSWVTSLHPDTFVTLLPLLRRTFSNFTPPERRQMGQRVRRTHGSENSGQGLLVETIVEADFDTARAETTLPLLAQLLGIAD